MSQAMPQEVIVVEGRDDTKRLIETFGPTVKTIETGGSALETPVLAQIVEAAKTHGIIVLTDPDYQGERLRRLVTDRFIFLQMKFIRTTSRLLLI